MNKTTSSLIAFLFIFFGCNNEIEKELYVSEVPILIAPKQIETSLTKTTTESFNQENVKKIGIIEVSNSSVLTPDGISPSGINNGYLEFVNPPLVYPVDGREVTLYGYYPTDCKTKISDITIHFTLTGKEDLMWAAGKSAGTKTVPTTVPLSFVHKLSKISFTISNEVRPLPTLPTSTLQIIARGVTSGTLNLEDGKITSETVTNDFVLETGLTLSTLTASTLVSSSLFLLPANDYTFFLKIGSIEYPIIFDDSTSKKSWDGGTHYTLAITIKALNTGSVPNAPTTDEPTTDEPVLTKSNLSIHHSITGNITIQDK